MLLKRGWARSRTHLVGRRGTSRDRAGILVIQDKLIGVEESPEQVLQDLEAVRVRFEVMSRSGQLFGRRVPAEGRQVDGIDHVGFG